MAPNITLSFGPMLIGTFVNMILYGILIMQTYHYYLTYKKDPAWIKALVYYLFIVESLNTAFNMQIMYQPLIQHFGEAEATKFFPMLFAAEPIVIVAISTPIQFFFAWRVRLLTKSNWLGLLICFFAIVSLAGGIWTTILIVKVKVFARKIELHWSALVWFLAACVADILITVVLVITLTKRKTGFSGTDDAIQKIIRMTVQTGAITAFFAVGDVVFFMTMGQTALNFLWDLALTKLYANCLLSTLNARASSKESSSFNNAGQNHSAGSNPRQLVSSPGPGMYHGNGNGNANGGVAGVGRTLSMSGKRCVSGIGVGLGSGAKGAEAYSFPVLHSSNPGSSAHTHYSDYDLDEGVLNLMPLGESKPRNSQCGTGDLEYGITVTKVVETLEDPRPATVGPYAASANASQCSSGGLGSGYAYAQ